MAGMAARLRGLFLVAFWFTLIAVLAPFMILATIITGNENMMYAPVRLFVRIGLALVGVRVVAKGLELTDPNQTYVFTPNHQSFIEVPLLVTYIKHNFAYLAKKELFKYPIWKQGIKLIGVVPIDRSNTQAAVESARLATENLRRGKSYVIYPEGTRSRDGHLLPFKKGAFMMAVEAGVPIVPVSISGSTKIMPKGEIKIFPSTIYITVHEPISTAGYTKESITELMRTTRAKIVSALSEEEVGENESTKNTKPERIESAGQN